MKIRFIAPFPQDDKQLRARRVQIPDDIVASDIEIEFVAVRDGTTGGPSPYDSLLKEMYVFEAGMRAEQEGCDALVVDTISDAGLDALRARLTIPVVGPGSVGYHVAAVLGRRFSVLSAWCGYDDVYYSKLAKYGLVGLVASVRSLDNPPGAHLSFDKDESVLEALKELSLLCVREDGADAIVLGSTTMHPATSYLTRELPIPVISPGVWAFKIAETLVRLRMSHSRNAYPPPVTIRDELWAALPSKDE